MENIDVLSLIPQKPPFVMVEKLLYANEKNAQSSFTISEENVLVEKTFFTEAGLIENMAQTCALHSGYWAAKNGKEPALGVIGGIKNLVIKKLPRISERIITSVSLEYEVMNAKILHGEICLNDEVIAECEIKVFLI